MKPAAQRRLTPDERSVLRWVATHHRFAPNPMGPPWVDLVADGLISITQSGVVIRATITEAGVEALQRGRRG